jgi:hypothetical protein
MGQPKRINPENERNNDSNDVAEEIPAEQVWPVSNLCFFSANTYYLVLIFHLGIIRLCSVQSAEAL